MYKTNRIVSYLVVFVALFSRIGFGEMLPCSTYTCDSLVIEEILSSEENVEYLDEYITVDSITDTSNGRIIAISMKGNIDLGFPRLRVISDSVAKLNKLKKIELIECGTISIPNTVGKLLNLEELNFPYSMVDSIPDAIGGLINLERMIFTGSNNVSYISDSIGKLTHLKVLKFDYMLGGDITPPLPSTIGNLINLDTLLLNSSDFPGLPESITNLQNLSELDIRSNKICKPSENVKAWADKFDPDWNSNNSQRCNSSTIQPQTTKIHTLLKGSSEPILYSINGRHVKMIRRSNLKYNAGPRKGIYISVDNRGVADRLFFMGD
jgi:hypothetical protein